MKKPKDILINVLLFIAIIIILLFFFEIMVRLLHISSGYDYPKGMYQKDELLDFSMTPDFKGRFIKQEFEIDIFTNSLGLRDVEYSSKQPNDFRILELGSSFTWGAYGVPLNKTYLKILQNKLNENSKDINYQVINAGVPGYGTDQQLLYLVNRGYLLEPDLVILDFVVARDFLHNVEMGESTVKNGFRVSTKPRKKILTKIRPFLLMNFHSYRLLEKAIITLFGDLIQKGTMAKSLNTYQRKLFLLSRGEDINLQISKTYILLNEMKLYLDSNDIKFAIVLIPLKYQADANLNQTFAQKNYASGELFDMELPQNTIKEWAMQNNVIVIDLLPEMAMLNQDNDFYLKLNPHLNLKGTELAGQIIYNGLVNTDLTLQELK